MNKNQANNNLSVLDRELRYRNVHQDHNPNIILKEEILGPVRVYNSSSQNRHRTMGWNANLRRDDNRKRHRLGHQSNLIYVPKAANLRNEFFPKKLSKLIPIIGVSGKETTKYEKEDSETLMVSSRSVKRIDEESVTKPKGTKNVQAVMMTAQEDKQRASSTPIPEMSAKSDQRHAMIFPPGSFKNISFKLKPSNQETSDAQQPQDEQPDPDKKTDTPKHEKTMMQHKEKPSRKSEQNAQNLKQIRRRNLKITKNKISARNRITLLVKLYSILTKFESGVSWH